MDAMLADDVHSVHPWTLRTDAMSAGTRLLRCVCPLPMRFLDKDFAGCKLPSTGWQLTSGGFDGI